ncbi:primase [Desulfoluna limicola]|uniref:Primase n=1 Tax=Desulfoluna limicola TaxID=2810562 RepID=A0ABM7PBG0_9BACT|nr:phage/plasmid primase, P4 family [Desulfoluna limicola]BCS94539.1 primase [Desulfoluna limicola]
MGIALDKLPEAHRADIANSLFQVDTKLSSDAELRGLCPFHNEQNASFSYNVAKDVYNCLGCQATGDLVKLYSHCRGLDAKEGFKAFLNEYGIESNGQPSAGAPQQPRTKQTTPTPQAKPEAGLDYTLMREAWSKFPPLPDSWVDRLAETRMWTREAIETLGLRMQTHRQDSKTGELVFIKNPDWRKIAFPIHEDGELVNIILYKPGASEFKMVSWAKGFGSTRLFPPAPLSEGPVLYVEGITDVVCALSMGFNPIANTTKPKKWAQNHLNQLMDRDIIVARDCDQPGMTYGEVSCQNLYTVSRTLKLINWPGFMGRRDDGQWPEKHGEDLTDFFAKHGQTPDDLQNLIDQAEPYVMKDPGEISCAREFFSYGVGDRLSFKPRLLAERILQDLSLLNDPETGLLYKWDATHWVVFKEDHVKKRCIKLLGEESKANRVSDASLQARMLSTIPHGRAVNDQEDWVCLETCMLNLETLNTRPHHVSYYSTCCLPIDYNIDPEMWPERWFRFLDETIQTPEVIAQLQEFFGYCLTRDTRYAKALFLFGPGADGKSTVIKILRHMVGIQNCSSIGFADLEDQFLRSSLYNKLLNISTEVGAKALDSPFFKAIVTGDPITAAFKHQDAFDFTPYCKLIFAANKKPRVLDNSDGFFRRVLPIQFKRQFLGDDADTNLEKDLMGELSYIFVWALEGLRRLRAQGGFTRCKETDDLLMEYKFSNNPILSYAEDRCEVGETVGYTTKDALFRDYNEWARGRNFAPMSYDNFFRELYLAIDCLAQYRARDGQKRVQCVKNISLKVVA